MLVRIVTESGAKIVEMDGDELFALYRLSLDDPSIIEIEFPVDSDVADLHGTRVQVGTRLQVKFTDAAATA